jgi:hypothetical protein
MANVELYVFEDSEGCLDTFTTFDSIEARDYASRNSRKMIAQIYEYTDSEVVEDFTGEPSACDEDCSNHAQDCDGYCDHHTEGQRHSNGCEGRLR